MKNEKKSKWLILIIWKQNWKSKDLESEDQGFIITQWPNDFRQVLKFTDSLSLQTDEDNLALLTTNVYYVR